MGVNEVKYTYRFIDIKLLEEMRLSMLLVHVNFHIVHIILIATKQLHKANFKI